MDALILKVDNVTKKYKLGQIGGTTLRAELQRKWAKIKGAEDPTRKISAQNVRYGEAFKALDGVSFEVRKGERIGIIGRNGAGKSTLLKLISRITAPSGGRIRMNGRAASMLEVGTGFHPELTGRENIYMNGAILGMKKKEIDAKIESIIEFSELRPFIDTPVKRYSSGMYVKLGFSIAAHLNSEILIMDEVLAVGDMAFQKKCLDKMNEVSQNSGRTILYVSHNMSTIRKLCSRVIVLDKGKLVFDGDVETGIAIYSNDDTGMAKTHYVYTPAYHMGTRSDGKLVIKEMVLQNSSSEFGQGEAIQMRLSCGASQDIRNVKFRFETYFSDGMIVGTSLSAAGVDFEAGKTADVKIEMPTKGLMPGRYSSDIVAYIEDEIGREFLLDGVYPGIVFSIQEKKNDTIWLHQYWGHIRLEDVRVEPVP